MYPTTPRLTRLRRAMRDSHNSFQEFCRRISTPRLHALLRFHLVPINVVISHDPITIPYLGVGFPLRCFQRLSFPDIATGRCRWYDSPQTRGQFISVLSSFIPRFLGAQTISSTFSCERGWRHVTHTSSQFQELIPLHMSRTLSVQSLRGHMNVLENGGKGYAAANHLPLSCVLSEAASLQSLDTFRHRRPGSFPCLRITQTPPCCSGSRQARRTLPILQHTQ